MKIRKMVEAVCLLLAVALPTGVLGAEKAPEEVNVNQPLSQLVASIEETMRANIYDAAVLRSPAYTEIVAKIRRLPEQTNDKSVFIQEFNELWKDGPFSHVNLVTSEQTPDQMATFYDSMNAGPQAVALDFENDAAILTVNTMMGQDTIRQIEAAYDQIADKAPGGLVIDLRNNKGGAFAIVPLVGHLISETTDAGVFLSNKHTSAHNSASAVQEIDALAAWHGWSIQAFWQDVATAPVTRVSFEPLQPYYGGRVYVLVSNITASAAELASDVLHASANVTLVGEHTAGEMLSQKPHPVGGNVYLFLPFADYISKKTGRIEGKGLSPDIIVPAQDALGYALERLAGLQ